APAGSVRPTSPRPRVSPAAAAGARRSVCRLQSSWYSATLGPLSLLGYRRRRRFIPRAFRRTTWPARRASGPRSLSGRAGAGDEGRSGGGRGRGPSAPVLPPLGEERDDRRLERRAPGRRVVVAVAGAGTRVGQQGEEPLDLPVGRVRRPVEHQDRRLD